jgi:uncharacterized YigZ family protein
MIRMKDNPPIEHIVSKSRFIGQCFDISHKDDILIVLHQLKKEHPKAHHFCYGYVIDETHQGFDDHEEPKHTAGKPILEALIQAHVTNTLCVVIRYFGGVLLGASGLTKAYRDTTYETLKQTTFDVLKLHQLFEIILSYDVYHKMKKDIMILGTISEEIFSDHVKIHLQTTHDIKTIKTQLYGIQKITFIQQVYL